MNEFGKFMSRLLAVIIFAFVIFDLPFFAESLLQIMYHQAFLYAIPLVLIYLLPIIISLIILIKPNMFAGFFGSINNKPEATVDIKSVLTVALVCMGVFVTTYATVYLLQEIFAIVFLKNEITQAGEITIISAEKKSELASYVFEIVMGVLLIFVSKPLTRKLIG